MLIVADENITQVREYFAPYGEVVTVPGRSITAKQVRDCDALLVRSVTHIEPQLLMGSRCRFVATATSGVDHIETEALAKAGIALGWARGCNAVSVVDYVFSVLAIESKACSEDWRGWSVGIIGCGEIGYRLAQRLLQLGIAVKVYDPLLPLTHPLAACFATLDDVLEQRVITLHVPLTREGPHPTWHMLGRSELDRIPAGSLLINAARGSAIDNAQLLQWLKQRPQQRVVLDTWESEPAISLELLQRVTMGTPHIAGYSHEGKLTGTHMILQQFCEYFSFAAPPELSGKTELLSVPASGGMLEQLNSLILAAHDVRNDHAAMQSLVTSNTPAADFDELRKHYPLRHQCNHYRVDSAQLSIDLRVAISVLGFRINAQS